MRLSKKKASNEPVNACEDLCTEVPATDPAGECTTAKHDAYHHIMEAIDALKECDSEDPVVVEAIANLAVVAFSLN